MTQPDDNALTALRLAAKFVLDHADEIDHHNQFALDLLKMTAPSATREAVQETREDSAKLRRDLDAVLAALKSAGLDD